MDIKKYGSIIKHHTGDSWIRQADKILEHKKLPVHRIKKIWRASNQ